jgi:BNR repeat-like domain
VIKIRSKEKEAMKKAGLLLATLGLFLFVPTAYAGWTTAQRLTWTSTESWNPAIAIGPSGNVHVVWYDKASGGFEIYYKRSTDGGSTWSTRKRLTWSGLSGAPDIAVDPSGNPHVVWMMGAGGNYEIFYKKSTDGGTTWLASKRLTANAGDSVKPALAVDSFGNPHLAWEDDTPGNYEIYYKKSTDGGTNWSTSKRLTWTSGDARELSITVDLSDNPHVVWYENTPGNYEIYYKRSTDGGAAWSPAKRLTWTSIDSQYPKIVADTLGNLYVAWQEYIPGNSEIYGIKSKDGGTTWSTIKRLTWTSGYSTFPDMVIDSSGSLHIVWDDSTPGNHEIYYKMTSDGGNTWSTSKRISWTPGYSAMPDIAAGPSGYLHVVWYDDTPGNDEIYYIKGK